MKFIGIIGPNGLNCSPSLYKFGVELGRALSHPGRFIVCGGHDGFMEAVCRGARQSIHNFPGQTIGILPGEDPAQANQWVDIPIVTGMGEARNIVIVNTADIVIAAGGGAGTLSELGFALKKNKKVLCITGFGGWAEKLSIEKGFTAVHSIDELLEYLG
jgi:uncharacterized protein (TIGR00725 family)